MYASSQAPTYLLISYTVSIQFKPLFFLLWNIISLKHRGQSVWKCSCKATNQGTCYIFIETHQLLCERWQGSHQLGPLTQFLSRVCKQERGFQNSPFGNTEDTTCYWTSSEVLRRPICAIRSLQENLKEQILFFTEESLVMKMLAGLNRKHVWWLSCFTF